MSQGELVLSPAECRTLAAGHFGSEASVQVSNVDVRPLGGARVGYMSDHLLVTLTVRQDSAPPQQLHFFAKSIPRNVPIHKEYVESTRFYEKETAFYDKLLKDMRKAQEDGGEDRWVPKSFLVRSDLIILEDLSLQNYKVFPTRQLMDLQLCEITFAEMARFHAASIVLEEKNRAAGETRTLKQLYPEMLEERSGSTLKSDGKRGWFQAAVRSLLTLAEHLPKYKGKPELVQKIRDKIPEACNVMNTIVETSKTFRNGVCHGDLYANNIMVRYSKSGNPVAVRFVDFQILRYAPPACDVLTLLYMMTSKQFRSVFRERILAYYYAEFAAELQRHKLDPEELFPLREFEETCVFYDAVGSTIAAVCLQMAFLKPEVVDPYFKTPELFLQFMLDDRSAEILNSFRNDEEYRQRIVEVVEEFIDKCVL